MTLTPDEQRLRERLTRYGSLNTDDSWMAIAIIDAERELAEKAKQRSSQLRELLGEAHAACRKQKAKWRASRWFALINRFAAERDEQRQRAEKAEAIIRQHDLCHDLHGKVGRDEFEEGCRRETVKEYGACGWDERIAALEAELATLRLAWSELTEVSANPRRLGGKPVLVGTRFSIAQLLAELADGAGPHEIAEQYDLDCGQIRRSLHQLANQFDRPIPQPQEPIDPYGPMPGSEDEGNLSEGGK